MKSSTLYSVAAAANLAFAQANFPSLIPSRPQVFDVQVGANSQLSFVPNTVTAKVGDIIRFTFHAINHTLTQCSLEQPCVPIGQIDTGFSQFNAADSDTMMVALTVNNPEPQYFFCHQTLPVSHCDLGMVFAINPGENIDVFFSNVESMGPLSSLVTSLSVETLTLTANGFVITTTQSGLNIPAELFTAMSITLPDVVLPTTPLIVSQQIQSSTSSKLLVTSGLITTPSMTSSTASTTTSLLPLTTVSLEIVQSENLSSTDFSSVVTIPLETSTAAKSWKRAGRRSMSQGWREF